LILVTGGAGFIGSNFVIEWLANRESPLVNLDKLTYAGNVDNLAAVKNNVQHIFMRGDINDRALVTSLLEQHRPQAIVHFAAESHVDRSIHGPDDFIQTNIVGTFNLLEAARAYWSALQESGKPRFRFLYISTDEVYGSLDAHDPPFSENSPYAPNSPYPASKAAADHLVRAYHKTYGLPTLITHCSNNYGPHQFPEKLIPLMTIHALHGKPLPVYGDGGNVRDWLYVSDHCAALRQVLANGVPGEIYNIGGGAEKTNLEVVKAICAIMDELRPAGRPHSKLITFVADRLGHDRRYAIDSTKIRTELSWRPAQKFTSSLRKTVQWYCDHPQWISNATSGVYHGQTGADYTGKPEQAGQPV